MSGFFRSSCYAIIYSSIFDRLFDFAGEEAALCRILWLTCREVEGIAGVHSRQRLLNLAVGIWSLKITGAK
jgi:hypothetical protein